MEDTLDYLDLFDHDLELYVSIDLEDNKIESSLSSPEKESGLTSDEDDVGCSLPQSKLSRKSLQFHQMEEQKMVFKMSFDKLRKIYDNDAYLCRWVMLRNTRKKLQREIESMERFPSSKRSFDDMNYCNIHDVDNDEEEPTTKRIR